MKTSTTLASTDSGPAVGMNDEEEIRRSGLPVGFGDEVYVDMSEDFEMLGLRDGTST